MSIVSANKTNERLQHWFGEGLYTPPNAVNGVAKMSDWIFNCRILSGESNIKTGAGFFNMSSSHADHDLEIGVKCDDLNVIKRVRFLADNCEYKLEWSGDLDIMYAKHIIRIKRNDIVKIDLPLLYHVPITVIWDLRQRE